MEYLPKKQPFNLRCGFHMFFRLELKEVCLSAFHNNRQHSPCCGPGAAGLFDPDPFYSVVGTCFRWRPIAEDIALSIRSVRFTMFMNKADSPGWY